MLPAGGSVGRGGKGWAQRPDSGLGGGGALSCGLCSRSERGVLRPFFHAGAQARVFREACAVGGGARTTPLARTTAPELCVQLRPGVSQVVDSWVLCLLSQRIDLICAGPIFTAGRLPAPAFQPKTTCVSRGGPACVSGCFASVGEAHAAISGLSWPFGASSHWIPGKKDSKRDEY